MNLFDPRTFSTDWEVMVIDRLERFVPEDKLMAFAGVLHRETELPIKVDWNTLEFAVGVNGSLNQIWERIRSVTDRAAQLVREFDLDLFPAGSHPSAPRYNASHVHGGTLQDESRAIRLEGRLMRYAPAFAALAANSPIARNRRGEFKSYRVRDQAHGCTRPASMRDPDFAQNVWGTDAGPKLDGAPTLEVRITDCASSRRLLAEFATFIAAFVHHCGTLPDDEPLSPREYRDALTNRWAAGRYGLQATFTWEGAARPVTDLLEEMLDACREELSTLGATRADLGVLTAMLRKRTCQADFVLGLLERYPDPWCLASAHAKLMRHWDVFDEYVEKAPVLDPSPLPDEDRILSEHLAFIGEGTHFYESRSAMHYPPPVADEIIARLIQQGAITKEISPKRGIVLSRTS